MKNDDDNHAIKIGINNGNVWIDFVDLKHWIEFTPEQTKIFILGLTQALELISQNRKRESDKTKN